MDGPTLARIFWSFCTGLVGAAMCPACHAAFPYAAGHNAIRASQVPIESSHSKCFGLVGFPEPAVSTGFMHSLQSALPNFKGA